MVKRELILYTLVMLAVSIVLAMVIWSRPLPDGLEPLTDGWEYRWSDRDEWAPIEFPGSPPDRDDRSQAQFRVQLPEFSYTDPTLFIYSIDLNAVVYVDGRQIYAFGNMETGGFHGWPWHLIDLGPASSGATMTVEVVSDYVDIGLFGDVLLGERAAQILRIYQRDIPRYAICAISIAVAMVFFGIFVSVSSLKTFLFFAGGAFVLAIRVFALTLTRQIMFGDPVFWEYVRLITYVLVPIIMALSIGEISGGTAARISRYLAAGLCAIFTLMIAGALFGLYQVVSVYFFADTMAIATLVITAALSIYAGARGNLEAFFISINFIVVGGFAIYSMLMFSGMAPWNDEVDFLMLFQLTAGLLFVLVRRFIHAHGVLQRTNTTLEERVAERTEELDLANRELEREKQRLTQLSITDNLTGVHTRAYVLDRLKNAVSESGRYDKPLSIILFDIDHFKRINDEYGHQSGDTVLVKITGTIATTLRESDVVGRYGGEEFLAVLPGTAVHEAAAVADRIRHLVENLSYGDDLPTVTISGGVAEYRADTPEELLKRADVCLYEAKAEGRNAIVS